jgi:hypothetical protein
LQKHQTVRHLTNSKVHKTVQQPSAINATTMPAFADRAKAIGAQLVFLMGVIEPSNWGVDIHKYPDGISSSVKAIRDRGLQVGLHTLPFVTPQSISKACSSDFQVQHLPQRLK